MDRQVKQRVVGAAILVVLGVIFIPIFLDDGGLERSVPDVADLPPVPQDDFASRVVPLDEAEIEALHERAASSVDSLETPPAGSGSPPDAAPAEAVAATEETPPGDDGSDNAAPPAAQRAASVPSAPVADELPAPRETLEAWTVQLGSFANGDNARRLIEKLREGGYPAYLERRVEQDTTVFKVRVGPQIRREEADQVRAQLEQQFALKGMLVRYR